MSRASPLSSPAAPQPAADRPTAGTASAARRSSTSRQFGVSDVRRPLQDRMVRLLAQMSLGIGAAGDHRRHHRHRRLSHVVCRLPDRDSGLQPTPADRDRGAGGVHLRLSQRPPDRTLVAGIGLAATIGAGATAQLGAMRISEEIDALEVMGIRSIAYLASTRVLAGVIVVMPLYCIAVIMAFVATRVGPTTVYGQSTGVYDHYFNTFLNPWDLIWSFVQAVSMAIVVMLVHTYYGFTA